jgi:hypothetical protein
LLQDERNVAWTQDESSLCIGLEVDDAVKGRDVKLEVHPKRMKLDIQGQTVLEGTFPADVKPDGCFFAMEMAENSKMCVITLEKRDPNNQRWTEVFEDDALDTRITDKVRYDCLGFPDF